MKQFFQRYTHWAAFLIIAVSFGSMLIDFKKQTPDIIALVLGGIGVISIGALTFATESRKRQEKQE